MLPLITFRKLGAFRLLDVLSQFAETGVIPDPERTNSRESVFLGFGVCDVDVCGAKVLIPRIRFGRNLTTKPGLIVGTLSTKVTLLSKDWLSTKD
jgi:hypothetical protein